MFQHIVINEKGRLPLDLESWMKYHQFQSKTITLILYALTGEAPTVPVDRHVYRFFQVCGLSNATEPEEMAYHLKDVFEAEDYIRINDDIGSLAQLFHVKDGPAKVRKALTPYLDWMKLKFMNWFEGNERKKATAPTNNNKD